MLHRRIPAMKKIPLRVRRAFLDNATTYSSEMVMYREACARVVLDALGYTGLNKAKDHNAAVSDARNWFKHDVVEDCESVNLFDVAGLSDYPTVREVILTTPAKYLGEDDKPEILKPVTRELQLMLSPTDNKWRLR